MYLRTPNGSPGPLLRVAVLGLGLLAVVLYVGCGRTPPKALWEPNADDTAAIDAVVMTNKATFMTSFAETALLQTDTVWPGTSQTRFRKEIRENPFKQRFRTNQLQHVFLSDSLQFDYRFIATLDTTEAETTCTVSFAETIPGILKLHAYKYTRFLRDSIIGTDTLKYYDTLFTDTSMVVEKPLYATTMDGCVLKKDAGQWALWKKSGGSRLYAPTPEDAPYTLSIYVSNGTVEDTLTLRPDTLHHGIQRFYADEELLTFKVGDSITLKGILTAVVDSKNLLHFDGQRHEFRQSDKIALTRPGVFRLYFEQIPIDIMYEMGGAYSALAWGAWIRVVE